MKIRFARTLLLALAGVAATAHCGKDASSSGTPPLGPTDVVVTWTFDGKPASLAECMAHGGSTVYVNLSATADPALHQTTFESCDKGTVKFPNLDTGDLGMPFIEGILLDDKDQKVASAELTATPTPGSTNVTLDFAFATGAGGMGATSSSATTAASSSATTAASSASATSSGATTAATGASTSTSSTSSGASTSSSGSGGTGGV